MSERRKAGNAGTHGTSDGGGEELPPAAVYVDIETLHPWPDNPRDTTDAVPVIMRSLKAFGFGRPLIAWGEEGERRIVVGHTTREAYLRLLKEEPDWTPDGVPRRGLVPVRWRDDWSEPDAAGYALADNRTAEFSLWDDEKLRGVLKGLEEASFEHLGDMGWDAEDLHDLLSPDDDPDPNPGPPKAIIQYNIVFDNEEQETAWFELVRWLKDNASGETIGERLSNLACRVTGGALEGE